MARLGVVPRNQTNHLLTVIFFHCCQLFHSHRLLLKISHFCIRRNNFHKLDNHPFEHDCNPIASTYKDLHGAWACGRPYACAIPSYIGRSCRASSSNETRVGDGERKAKLPWAGDVINCKRSATKVTPSMCIPPMFFVGLRLHTHRIFV